MDQEVQQPLTTCASYGFSECNYSFANKVDILYWQQKSSRFEASAQN